MVENQNYEAIRKFLIALGFEKIKSPSKRISWIHRKKSINYQLDLTKDSFEISKNSIKEFLQLIKENFSSNELNDLLIHFLKEDKISFNKRGKSEILKIEPILENELDKKILFYLLPEKTKNFCFDYTTPIDFSKKLKTRIKKKFIDNLENEIAIQTSSNKSY